MFPNVHHECYIPLSIHPHIRSPQPVTSVHSPPYQVPSTCGLSAFTPISGPLNLWPQSIHPHIRSPQLVASVHSPPCQVPSNCSLSAFTPMPGPLNLWPQCIHRHAMSPQTVASVHSPPCQVNICSVKNGESNQSAI